MQLRKILCSPSLAFDSAHVKYGVWTSPQSHVRILINQTNFAHNYFYIYIDWLVFFYTFSGRASRIATTHATPQSSDREGLGTVEQNHTSTDTWPVLSTLPSHSFITINYRYFRTVAIFSKVVWTCREILRVYYLPEKQVKNDRLTERSTWSSSLAVLSIHMTIDKEYHHLPHPIPG